MKMYRVDQSPVRISPTRHPDALTMPAPSREEIDGLFSLLGTAPKEARLAEIFLGHALSRQIEVLKNNTKFVHYTTATAALEIIKNAEVWMRRASCMNDFREVQHGLDCLYGSYRDPESGKAFKAAIEDIDSGLTNEVEALFDGWTPHFFADTYLTCLSEHDEAMEANYGRLSMWRAYGSDVGVAMVMNMAPFYSTTQAFGAVTSPVAYLDDPAFRGLFDQLTKRIVDQRDFLRGVGREDVKINIFNAFRFAALSTKHPGFREEREWRIVYSPLLSQSEYIEADTATIRGVPQPIYKIPLRDIPEIGLKGASIPDLLNRIIIGPTQYRGAVRDAFVNLLSKAKVPDPEKRVFNSDIPLRTAL